MQTSNKLSKLSIPSRTLFLTIRSGGRVPGMAVISAAIGSLALAIAVSRALIPPGVRAPIPAVAAVSLPVAVPSPIALPVPVPVPVPVAVPVPVRVPVAAARRGTRCRRSRRLKRRRRAHELWESRLRRSVELPLEVLLEALLVTLLVEDHSILL